MSEQNQQGGVGQAPPSAPPATEPSKFPKGLFAALKKSIIETAPQVKGPDKKFVPDPKFVEAVGNLKAEEVEVASSKGNTFVVHAGKYGLRKVTL